MSSLDTQSPDKSGNAPAACMLHMRVVARAALSHLVAEHGDASPGESAVDERRRRTVAGALAKTAFGIQEEFGLTDVEVAQYKRDVLQDVTSWGRDGIRCLGLDPEHDLRREGPPTGAALLAWKHGVEPRKLARVAAAALRVGARAGEMADSIGSVINVQGPAAAIRQFCELPRDDQLLPLFLWMYACSQPEDWKQQLAARAHGEGLEVEAKARHCGQATLSAILQSLDFREDAVVRAATPLAGGVALCGDGPCCSYLGATLALGVFAGRRRSRLDGDREAKQRCLSMCAELRRRYTDTYGGPTCQQVQLAKFGRCFDVWDEREREALEAAGAHMTGCTDVVGLGARWAVEILCQPPIRSVRAYEVGGAVASEGKPLT